MRTIIALFILATCTSALAESTDDSAGMMRPPAPMWWVGEEPPTSATIAQEGVFILRATYSGDFTYYDEVEQPQSVTVTDADVQTVDGEATYDGRGTVLWRATNGGLEAGATLSAHVELYQHPEAWEEDIILDIDLTVASEASPAAQAAEITEHVPGDRYPLAGHSCYTVQALLSWQEPAATPEWMGAFLHYTVVPLHPDGTSGHPDYRLGPAQVGISYYGEEYLGDTYCARITTTSFVDGSEASVESCLDAEVFAAESEEDEVMCTVENLADHEIAETDGDSSGCDGGPVGLGPWMALLALALLVRRRRVAL